MKKTLGSFVGLIVLIFVCTSGLIEPITKVFIWLITLQFNSPNVSVFGQLVAKYGTWIITYSVVGYVFSILDWFNSTAMKIVYFIISTIISFLLSWLIMILENYLWIIAIIVGVILIIVIGVIATLYVVKKKKESTKEEVKENA